MTDANDFRLHGWQDMELNEYLYANGEVKLQNVLSLPQPTTVRTA